MAHTAVKSAHDHAADFTPRLRTIALIVVSMGFIMDLLDNTIVNIAIPSIQANLGTTYSTIQWLIAGYSLTFALLLITGGRMGDVFGYKKVFLGGMFGFTIASLLCGVAQNPGMLIAARLLQGSMAALMVPQVISLMQIMYKPEERGAINGMFGAMAGVAASLGPVIGGLLIKANIANLDWRPIFLINVPVGILAGLAAIKYLPDGKSPHPLKLDLTGTVIIMVTLLLLVFPLIQGRERNWPLWTFAMLAAAVPFLALFVYQQRRRERVDGSSLVLPSLFKNRSFGVGLALNMVFEAAMLGFFLTFTLVLQVGLGFSAVHAALTGLPLAFGIALTMAIMGEKIPKLGRRAFMIGTTVMASGLALTAWMFWHYQLQLHSWQLIPGLLITGIGMGFVFSSLFAAVLNGVDARHAGSASGMLNAVQQVGGAVGIAVIGVIFFGQLNHGAAASAARVEPAAIQQLAQAGVPAAARQPIVHGFETCFVDRSKQTDTSQTPPSCKAAATPSSKAVGTTLQQAGQQANATNFTKAFHWGTIYEIGLLAVTFAMTFLLPKKFKAEAYNEGV